MVEVRELIRKLRFSESEYELFEQLMKRFEIEKKVYVKYNDDITTSVSSKTINQDEYIRIVICLCILFIKYEDVRFYNTALKICDLIDVGLPEINI